MKAMAVVHHFRRWFPRSQFRDLGTTDIVQPIEIPRADNERPDAGSVQLRARWDHAGLEEIRQIVGVGSVAEIG